MTTTNNATNNDRLTTNGQLLIGSTSASPVVATISAGTNVTVTNGAGSITIASTGAAGASVFAQGYGNTNNDFYIPMTMKTTASTISTVANSLYCVPIIIPISTAFTKIGIETTTGSAATGIRLGIYDNTGTGGYPGARVVDAGNAATTGASITTLSITQTLQGAYWLVGICNSASPIFRAGAASASGTVALTHGHVFGFVGMSAGNQMVASLSEASVSSYYTALPSSLTSDTFAINADGASTITNTPMIFLKV